MHASVVCTMYSFLHVNPISIMRLRKKKRNYYLVNFRDVAKKNIQFSEKAIKIPLHFLTNGGQIFFMNLSLHSLSQQDACRSRQETVSS